MGNACVGSMPRGIPRCGPPICPAATMVNSARIGTLVVVAPANAQHTISNFVGPVPPETERHRQNFDVGGGAGISSRRASMRILLELSMRQHALIVKFWRRYISHPPLRDIFHRTMLASIEASPKLNEVIACGRCCFRDLTKWPKLNRICQAQYSFFERLIFAQNLNEQKLTAECASLGHMHARFAQHGMKAHFLDIFQQQFLYLLSGMEVRPEDADEKAEAVGAFSVLITFVTDVMNHAYSLRHSAEMNNREKEEPEAGGGP